MNDAMKRGLAQIERGRYEAAHAGAIALIHANINDPVPYFLLARIALDHRNYVKAEELFARARSLQPDEPLYLAGYAQYLVIVARQAEALTLADEAAQLPIHDAFAADTLGVVYSRTGFHEKAVPFFERAVELNPKPANFHYNLGASLQFSGEFERAEAAYQATIERQADSYRAWSAIVGLREQTADENHLPRLEAMFELQQGDPDAALHLGHAIAKTLEDLGRLEESYDWLVRAKRDKRQAVGYDIESDLALFEAAAATAVAASAEADAAASDAAPIFVVGLPRTGTTLVDRILSSHPDVVSAGELNTFAGLIKAQAKSPSNRVLDVEALQRAAEADLTPTGRSYVEQTKGLTRGAARFTDKMPLNFFYAALIHRALPGAKIVALRRDPADSCLSNFRQLFSMGFSYYNYTLDIVDTAAYYKAFAELMRLWRNSLPAGSFMELHYEDIVHDQEAKTRELLAFCKLPWNEACLRFHENEAPVSTASSVQVRQPLYSGSIGRWKKYGSRLYDTFRGLELVDETEAGRNKQ